MAYYSWSEIQMKPTWLSEINNDMRAYAFSHVSAVDGEHRTWIPLNNPQGDFVGSVYVRSEAVDYISFLR